MKKEIEDLVSRLVSEIERLESDNASLRAINSGMKENGAGSIRITDLGLSKRAMKACRWLGIETLRELAATHLGPVIQMRNIGRKTSRELEDLLHTHGLTWGMWYNPTAPLVCKNCFLWRESARSCSRGFDQHRCERICDYNMKS